MAEQTKLTLFTQTVDLNPDEAIKQIITFAKSSSVQVFPSGRRGSNRDRNNNAGGTIPFDPEARLNTEANNRKHTAVNGYTQTYLKGWDMEKGILTFAVDGYLFDVTLTGTTYNKDTTGRVEWVEFDYSDIVKFVEEALGYKNADRVYVNVVAEEVKLFSGDFGEYFTEVLRDQPVQSAPSTSLDLLRSFADPEMADEKIADNYYFAGLSFSTTSLAEQLATSGASNGSPVAYSTDSYDSVTAQTERDGDKYKRTATSLCLLAKDTNGVWQIYQPALLPEVRHGVTEGSIVLGDTTVKDGLIVENHTESKTIKATELIETPEIKVTTLKVDNISGYIEDKVVDIQAAEATIDTIHSTTATIVTVNSDDIQQKIGETYCDVPVIFVQPKTVEGKTEYQLQIKRANHLS